MGGFAHEEQQPELFAGPGLCAPKRRGRDLSLPVSPGARHRSGSPESPITPIKAYMEKQYQATPSPVTPETIAEMQKSATTYFRGARDANEKFKAYKLQEVEKRAMVRQRSMPLDAARRLSFDQVASAAAQKHRDPSAGIVLKPNTLFKRLSMKALHHSREK